VFKEIPKLADDSGGPAVSGVEEKEKEKTRRELDRFGASGLMHRVCLS
jgi:hypothetical protein